MRCVRATISVVEKQKYYILWMCVCVSVCVVLVIHHAMRMRHIVIRGLPALQSFSTLSHKRHDFRNTVNEPAGRGFDSRWCHWNFSVT